MTTLTLTHTPEVSSFADKALKTAARTWFAVAMAGQFIFAFAVASFYGLTALRGDLHGWSRFITGGWIPGDTMGNFAIALHLSAAVVIMSSGTLQFLPRLRARHPRFHRWNGRVYLLTSVVGSTAGLYMQWARVTVGDLTQKIGSTGNVVLVLLCAAMAFRYAVKRDFRTHRRWALRFFLVISAAWFFRIAFFLVFLIFQRPVGFDPATLSGPLLTFMVFGQYLVPLAILELYFLAQDRPGPFRRLATAALLFVCTLGMVGGLTAVTLAVWAPHVKMAFDTRKPIAVALARTIDTKGIDAAVAQYHVLKSTQTNIYNFDRAELNALGYDLLRAKRYGDAIRVFQLNLQTYPTWSNGWDSLAEAYLKAGDRMRAIAHYQKAVDLDPKNFNAAAWLRRLRGR